MENKAHALATGLFLLLLGLALAGTVAWFQGDRTEHVRYTVVAHGGGVQGLNLKSAVKLRGVDVGRVETLGFDPTQPRDILIGIAVDPAAPVSTTVHAQLGLQGVTGLSFVSLEDTSTGALQRAQPGARIELRASPLERLAESGPALIAGLAQTADRLNQLLSDQHTREVGRALTRLGDSAEAATRLMNTLQPSAQALPGLLLGANTTLADTADAARDIRAFAVEGRLLAQQWQQSAGMLQQLGSAAQQVQATSRSLELALVGDGPPRGRPLLGDLSAASRGVERVAGELGEQPQSLLFGRGPLPPGPGEAGFSQRPRSGP